jgi:LysR family hydrogen peroxide-inducible transcriptional activator
VLPCTAASGPGHYASKLTEIRPFTTPPQRRVALAWRVSFPRPQAIEALRQAIRACALDCVTYLGGPAE